MTRWRLLDRTVVALVVVLVAVLALAGACSDDDDGAGSTTTLPASSSTGAEASTTTVPDPDPTPPTEDSLAEPVGSVPDAASDELGPDDPSTTVPPPPPTEAPPPPPTEATPDTAPLNEVGEPLLLDQAGDLACANAEFARDDLLAGRDASGFLADAADWAGQTSVVPLAELADDLAGAAGSGDASLGVTDAVLDVCIEHGYLL